MQRPHRARRAVVFHDDRIANEEEIVKKKRLETSKKRRTNEGFCEDLARQNAVAHLSQLQLGFGVVIYGFLCCHIWVSVIAVVS
jgi:hypothetical protein